MTSFPLTFHKIVVKLLLMPMNVKIGETAVQRGVKSSKNIRPSTLPKKHSKCGNFKSVTENKQESIFYI